MRVLPQMLIAGRLQWLAGPSAVTDDRGMYRIAGLGPGKYAVSVPSVQATLPTGANIPKPGAVAGSAADMKAMRDDMQREKLFVDSGNGQQLIVGRFATSPPPSIDGQRTAYPIVFYPNVTAPTDSAAIDLGPGEDRSSIDVQLVPVRAVRVSGVVDGPPAAVANLHLRLVPIGLEELGQGSEVATTVTRGDGRFTFVDVPSGNYVLEAHHSSTEISASAMDSAYTGVPAAVPLPTVSATSYGVAAAPPGVNLVALRDREPPFWAQRRLDVGNRDIDDIVLPLQRPISMTVRLAWASGTPDSRPMPVLEPADGRRSLGLHVPLALGMGASQLFTLEGLKAGSYLLRLMNAPGITIESIVWDGQDYFERPFDTTGGRDIENVLMTLRSAASSISGTVVETGPVRTSAAVIAFPVDRDRWSNYGFNPLQIKSAMVRTDRAFQLDGLPAGDYYVVAVPAAQERAWTTPGFFESLTGRATVVRLQSYDTKIPNIVLSLVK